MIDKRGTMLIFILVFGAAAFTIIISGAATYGIFEHRASIRLARRDLSFHIAEAGINYYRWHLAHDPMDFEDGSGQPGPYIHPYNDKDGITVGYYSLQIQPPPAGTTVLTVSSTAWTVWEPAVRRTIAVRLGFPALTDYAIMSNADMTFNFNSVVSGAIHSNGGIRFDGSIDSWVRSAKDRYEYQPGQWKNGVWGSGRPAGFWQFPVPPIDFFSISADLAALRTLADDGGVHLTSSNFYGWYIFFRGAVYDLYRVTEAECHEGQGRWVHQGRQTYWEGTTYCYDMERTTVESLNNPLPENGAIFVEDNVWVDGVVDGRVTVGAGRFPVQEPYPQIYVKGNLTYAARGYNDVIGLMAQGDIAIPYEVPDTMYIDGALLSQFGAIHRPYYDGSTKNSINIFGSQIYYSPGAMNYVNGWGHTESGFINARYTYDGNLRYYPPPAFPVGNTYELISWEEGV